MPLFKSEAKPEGLCTACSATQYCAEHAPEDDLPSPFRETRAYVRKVLRDGARRGASFVDVNSATLRGLLERAIKWERSKARAADEVVALTVPSAAPPAEGWQPIETAPKDGRRLLMFLGDARLFPEACVLRWGIEGGGEEECWIDAEEFAPDPQPTHWMPLPAPPRAPQPAPESR